MRASALCFVIQMALCQVRQASTESAKTWQVCAFNAYDFLNIYGIYLRDVNMVTITLVETDAPSQEMNYFADMIARYVVLKTKKKPIVWTRSNLAINFSSVVPKVELEAHRFNDIHTYKGMFDNVTTKIKTNSLDRQNAFIVIIWDVYNLEKLLNEDPKIIQGYPRGIRFILFVKSSNDDEVFDFISKILSRFWLQFGIFNVISTYLCAESSRIYVYNPFHYENKSWGKVNALNLSTIKENPNVLFDFMDNFNGYPVRISLFKRPPTAINRKPTPLVGNKIYEILKKSAGYGGVDGCFVAFLSAKLNFSANVSQPVDRNMFGAVRDNNITGSLGQVISKTVDISANGRFVMDYGTEGFEFTTPVSNDLICVVVPKSERIPQWRTLFRGFSEDTWLMMFGVAILCSCFWYIIAPIRFPRKTAKPRSMVASFLAVFGILINVSTKLPQRLGQRVFIASLLAFNVILTGIFQGTLVRSFTAVSYYPDINTLKQLDRSGLSVATSLSVFNDDRSELMRRLQKKVISINSSAIERAAYQKDVAAMERQQDANLIIHTNYMKQGMPLLHIVNECPTTYFISYIVPKGSPFLPKFNAVILNFFEAGLVDKWYSDFIDAIILEKSFYSTELGKKKPFTVSDIQIAFYILIFGISLSCVVFVLEKVFSHHMLQ